MKFLATILLTLLLTSIVKITYAEDVLIIHQGYNNSHSKWKNRLEDAGHTVTSVNIVSSSFPTDTTSYEQIYDVRYSYNLTSAQETAYKALLARGGTLYLQGDNPGCCNSRNQNIIDFIEDELGGGTITYGGSGTYSSNSITQHNTNESWLSSFSGTVTFAAGGVLTAIGNGTWFAKDGSGKIVGAVWYGDDLSNSYTGKVIVITDINFNSHSSYYTTTNRDWMNAMRTMLASTYNSGVAITASQTTTKNAAINATRSSTDNVYITQTGAGTTIDIFQDGTGNFIVDTDWSGPAVLNGDNQVLNVDQLTNNNGLGLGMAGDNIQVTVAQGTSGTNGGHKAVIDIDAASNIIGLTQYDGGTLSQHFALIDVDGASNNIQVTQRDNGQKVLFMDVDVISADVDILQKDTGTHYLELNLTGSAAHDVDITQQGTGDHAARVTLGGGYATDFDLLQQGSTDQSYELNSTCSNALGCTVNVTQGN